MGFRKTFYTVSLLAMIFASGVGLGRAATSSAAHRAYRDAESLYFAGDPHTAIEKLLYSTQERPEFVHAHYLLGLCYRQAGQIPRAEEPLRETIRLAPAHFGARVNLARVLIETDRPEDALEILEEANRFEPDSDELWNVRGRALMAGGSWSRAEAAFSRAIEINPDNVYALNNLGYCRIQQGRFEDALQPLRKANDHHDAPAYVFNNLGAAYERTGDLACAAKAYTDAHGLEHEVAETSLKRVNDELGPEATAEIRCVEEPVAEPTAVAAMPVEPEPEIAAPDTSKEEPKPLKKAKPKKRKKRDRERRANSRISVRGALSLRVIYDDNYVHYSDDDIDAGLNGHDLHKFAIESFDDWIVRPRMELSLASKIFGGRKTSLRLRYQTWRYSTNDVKNNESYQVRLRHTLRTKDYAEVTLYRAPMAFLRLLSDRPPFTSRSTTPLAWGAFSYSSNSATFTYFRKLSKSFETSARVGRSIRYYNRPFMENDNWEWNFGGTLGWRFAKKWRIKGEYIYSDVEARSADAVGETIVESDNSDPVYERDSYKITLDFFPRRSLWKFKWLSLKGQYQAYYFTTNKSLEDDPYHRGRLDRVYRTEFTVETYPMIGPLWFEGGYRFTERTTESPWTGSFDEGGVSDDKDYTDNRVWGGVVYPFK